MQKLEKRHDPVSRPPLGSTHEDPWTNKKPDRHYVEVHAKADWHGVDYYSELGYEVEIDRKDGPKLKSGRSRGEGTECSRLGCVLMSCPMEDYLARKGEGQTHIDALARRMADPTRDTGAVSGGATRVSYDGTAEVG